MSGVCCQVPSGWRLGSSLFRRCTVATPPSRAACRSVLQQKASDVIKIAFYSASTACTCHEVHFLEFHAEFLQFSINNQSAISWTRQESRHEWTTPFHPHVRSHCHDERVVLAFSLAAQHSPVPAVRQTAPIRAPADSTLERFTQWIQHYRPAGMSSGSTYWIARRISWKRRDPFVPFDCIRR
jgi:hypothetical protein